MPPTASRKALYRTGISRTEQVIGGAVILLLAGIGAGIWLKGRHYDPARYTGSLEALESTRQTVEGKAATLRNEADLRDSEQAAAGAPAQAAATPSAAGEIPVLAAGLAPMGPTETYSEETLYEKINGRAPAYIEYNFRELRSRSFTLAGQPGEFVDVYLFAMDSPLNAFGIFSAERDASGEPLEFAPDGYRSAMGYFLRAGRTYVQVLASSTQPAVMEPALEVTRGLAATLPADDSGLEARLLLPARGQVPGSLTYINENAYGQEVLSAVFEARYTAGGAELTLFAQHCADTATAATHFAALRDFYQKYGELAPLELASGEPAFAADMFGQWSLVVQRGSALLGVVNADDPAAARSFLLETLEGL